MTYRQTDPICPHCNHPHRDALEWEDCEDGGSGQDRECDSCGKPFKVERHVEVTYSTWSEDTRPATTTEEPSNG